MESVGPEPEFESRIKTADLGALTRVSVSPITLRIANVNVRIEFEEGFPSKAIEFCRAYLAPFTASHGRLDWAELRIVLHAPPGDLASPAHPIWNEPLPFYKSHFESTGVWKFHRDFTSLETNSVTHAWMPTPDEGNVDGLDNLLVLSAQDIALSKKTFLFHSTIVEHKGKAVVLFGPSGIGKTTVARMSRDAGYRVMSSDQAFLHLDGKKLFAMASPTSNPDIPRDLANWATAPTEVKTMLSLRRTGRFETCPLDRAEIAKRIFAEIFSREHNWNFAETLKIATEISDLDHVTKGQLSYPKGFDFWPSLEEKGLI
jgi:hypothetical protein